MAPLLSWAPHSPVLPVLPQTPMGRRLLRSWVGKPLRHREAIEARLDAVQELVEQGGAGPWGTGVLHLQRGLAG